jgi:hypothetical protein
LSSLISLDGSPVAWLGWASQLFGTPLRLSGFASLEWERFPNANVDYSAVRRGCNTSTPVMTRD